MAEDMQSYSVFNYVFNNPLTFTDPDGMAPSTEVVQNDDGSYTVVGAENDKDTNIYLVNNKTERKRTGEIIGQTENPCDFMQTDDKTGKFTGHVEVTFDLYYLPSGDDLIEEKSKEWKKSVVNLMSSRLSSIVLAWRSKNGGDYDVKSKARRSTGGLYTAMSYGGKITTIRTIGNLLFGINMRSINTHSADQLKSFAGLFYLESMKVVGAYNQYQNNGNGYNKGFPFFGEHTYSGTSIFQGYFGYKP